MSRDEENPCTKGLVLLPTNKYHVSFSELSGWVECSWRHKLQHIDKINIDDRSHYLDFGIAIHAAAEHYTRTKKLDITIATDIIKQTWKKYNHEINECKNKLARLDVCLKQAESILNALPSWLEKTFPNWKCIKAEHFLYEKIEDRPHAFKGYIDAVIEVEQIIRKKKKKVIWLIDWKTSVWGWDRKKKQDPHRKRQLIYYKKFWSQETGVDLKDIKCGFVLLKRTAKQHCELMPISVGDISTKRSLKIINNMLYCVNNSIALKNKTNCIYCVYKGTNHCSDTSWI